MVSRVAQVRAQNPRWFAKWELYMLTSENPVTADRRLRQAGGQTEAGGRQGLLASSVPLPGGGIWGCSDGALDDVCGRAARRAGLHFTFVRSRYGGWFALRPLVRFAVHVWIERLHCNYC